MDDAKRLKTCQAFDIFVQWQRSQFVDEDRAKEARMREKEARKEKRRARRAKWYDAMTLEERELRSPDAYFYSKARCVSFAEAMEIVTGFEEQYGASEEHQRRKDERTRSHNIACRDMEKNEPDFKAKHYRHPFMQKPTFTAFGLQSAKKALQDHATNRVWSPCLLYGPPWCGKKTTVNIFAHESNRAIYIFPAVSPQQQNDSERRKKEICAVFWHAFKDKDSILLLDQIDTLLSGLDQEESSELVWLFEKIVAKGEGRMTIIGTSSHPWKIDPRILEYFGPRLHVNLPSQDSIQRIWKHQIEQVAGLTQCKRCESSVSRALLGCTAADIVKTASKTSMMVKAGLENGNVVCMHHYNTVTNSLHSSAPRLYMKTMEAWDNKIQSEHQVLYRLQTG